MKSLLRHTAATAAAVIVTTTLHAQTLNVTSPQHASVKLFDSTPGFTIAGFGVSPSGDIYYIENAFGSNSQLFKRSPLDGYTNATPLFDLGTSIFGSFVAVNGGKVFFGESSTGAIRSINLDGTGVDMLGTITGNYDLAFAGSSLYLSHKPGPGAVISKFELVADGTGGLMFSAADTIIDTSTDFSGPVEFGPAGSLFYGGTGFAMRDLFRFSAAEVAGAIGENSALALDNPHLFLANDVNGALAFSGVDELWQTNNTTLNVIDTDTKESTQVATTTNFMGQLDYVDGKLIASVSNFGAGRSSVYAVVPEPSCALFAFVGLAALTTRRRK